MYFLGLFLKSLYELKLGSILYPLFHLFNFKIFNNSLPSIQLSKKIINSNIYNPSRFSTINNIRLNISKSQDTYYNVQIIIPVYNSEKYIRQCLNSVLNQRTNYKFQIIIVNDGSTDGTCKILKSYASNPIIKIINEVNRGRSVARNTGLKFVNSKYVMFVDSDDELLPNAVQELLDDIYRTRSDIVMGSCYTLFNSGRLGRNLSYDSCDALNIKLDNNVDHDVWGKVFKSSLFKKVRFPIGYEFEDIMLSFLVYPRCNKISSISSRVYLYRYNPSSISRNFQFTHISIDMFLILSLMIRSLYKYNIPLDQYIYNTFLNQVKVTCMKNVYISTKIQKSIFVLICYLYRKYFKNFSTNINYYIPLENSLKNENYNDYILFCIMK